MNPQEAAALLDLIVERAPALRAVGIRRVNLGAASFELDPDSDSGPGAAHTATDAAEDQSLSELLAGVTGDTKKERPPL